MASKMENVVARVHDTDEHVDTQSEVETLRSHTHRSRSSHYMRCWHCGHTWHIRRHCFRRMRQQRQRCMHDAQTALTQVREAATVTEYASDGDVTFASSVPPAYFDGCSLSPRWSHRAHQASLLQAYEATETEMYA